MQKTSNYNLNKPEANDLLRVEDFNENADIMDTALAGLNTAVDALSEERFYLGSYVGNGVSNRTIQLRWEPKVAILMGHYSTTEHMHILTQEVSYLGTGSKWATDNGFSEYLNGSTLVFRDAKYCNVEGTTVRYILFR